LDGLNFDFHHCITSALGESAVTYLCRAALGRAITEMISQPGAIWPRKILCAPTRSGGLGLQIVPQTNYPPLPLAGNAMSFVLRLVGTGNPMPFVHFGDRIAAAQAAQAAVRTGEVKRAEVYAVSHETVAKAIDAVIRGEGELVEVRHAPEM
jgi:hypothetical protein